MARNQALLITTLGLLEIAANVPLTALAQDPALMKYANMYVNRHKFFRWTRRTAGLTFAYAIAFPAFVGYWAYTTDVSCNLSLPGMKFEIGQGLILY